MSNYKDLRNEPPRSPHVRVGDYVILALTIDKCRALIAGHIGDYHFDCPVDRMLFTFKGVDCGEFRRQVENSKSDAQLLKWLKESGLLKTPAQIRQWSDQTEATRPYDDPERRDWFIQQCQPLGLEPTQTTLFDWLDADDRASFTNDSKPSKPVPKPISYDMTPEDIAPKQKAE